MSAPPVTSGERASEMSGVLARSSRSIAEKRGSDLGMADAPESVSVGAVTDARRCGGRACLAAPAVRLEAVLSTSPRPSDAITSEGYSPCLQAVRRDTLSIRDRPCFAEATRRCCLICAIFLSHVPIAWRLNPNSVCVRAALQRRQYILRHTLDVLMPRAITATSFRLPCYFRVEVPVARRGAASP